MVLRKSKLICMASLPDSGRLFLLPHFGLPLNQLHSFQMYFFNACLSKSDRAISSTVSGAIMRPTCVPKNHYTNSCCCDFVKFPFVK